MPLKKLKPEEKASTEALLAAIEHKDRRFRLFQTLFMAFVFIALIIVIGAQQRLLVEIKNQAEQQAAQDNDQQNKIIRRLNCMVVFFSKTDRQNLSIDDIDRCSLNRDEDITQFFADPEETPAEQPPNLNSSASTTTLQNVEAPVTDQPQDENPPTEEQPPATLETPLVDVPLCVPLLDVCVR